MVEGFFTPDGAEKKISLKSKRVLEQLREGCSVNMDNYTPKEQNEVGLGYWYGHIVPLNYKEAVKWYRASAEKKYKTAEFNLYVCYSKGTGVEIDWEEAMYWLCEAAEHNEARAQLILAENYYYGRGIVRNHQKAAHWFKKSYSNAFKSEDSVTLNSLGVNFYLGKYGFENNKSEAIRCFVKAGKLKNEISIAWLIQIFMEESDVRLVKYWMQKFNERALEMPMDLKLKESTEHGFNLFIARVESSPESLLSAGEYMLRYLGNNLVIKRNNSQTWQQLDEAFCSYLKNNDEIDYYEFLHFLSQYKYWSTRTFAWKSLRDRFAPDYKEWLQKRNQQMEQLNKDNDVSEDKSNDTEVKTPEISTGYDKLDDVIRDLGKAKVCIIAGKSSLGKTALAVSIAKNVAIDQRIPTLFLSLEMSTQQLTRRIVSNLCELEIEKIKTNTFDETEHEIYEEGMKRLNNSPLWVYDNYHFSIYDLCSMLPHMVNEYGIRLVIIDCLQQMDPIVGLYYIDEVEEIEEYHDVETDEELTMRHLKRLARELNITVIACNILPKIRGGERRRPGFSAIKKYYVKIEKEADIIIGIHLPELYCYEEGSGETDIIVAKNAFGEKGNFRLFYRPRFSRFYNQ